MIIVRMRQFNIRENAVRDAQQLHKVSIGHILGKHNPADIFTNEFKSFRSIRDLLLFPSFVFLVPHLPGGC
jgi:hypothetical protein